MPQAAEGEYEVRLLPPPVWSGRSPPDFRVDPPVGERERIEMNQPELIRAAAAQRRQVLHAPDGRERCSRTCPPPSKVPLDTDPPIPLWNTWPVLALFLALITLEWVLRKRKQMV